MPLRVCTGFEHGVSNLTSLTKGNTGNKLFDVAAGSPTMVSTGSIRTGTYCLELNPSAASEFVGWTTGTFGASQNRAVLSFWFMFPGALPSADAQIIDIWKPNVDAELWFRNSDDKLVATVEGNMSTGVAGPTVVADTWYHVEMLVDCSAVTHTLDWTVDGAAQGQDSSAQASGALVQVNLGDADNTQTINVRFDDVLLWTDTAAISGYPFGGHKVVLLKPDTGGTTAEIGTANATGRMVTNSAIDATHNSANILAATSEVPPLIGASATGVGQRTSGSGNAVGIPMTTYTLAGGESTPGMRILVCGWAGSTTANNFGMRTFNGTTEATLFAAADPNFDNNTTSPAWLCKMATDGHFDTQGEIDALVVRLGYSTDISPLPGAHAVYAELAVLEASGPLEVDLSPVTMTLTPQALDVVAGVVNLDLSPVTLTLAPQALDPAAPPLEVDLSPVTFSLAPQALDPVSGVVNLDLVPVTLALTPQALDVVAGLVNLDLSPVTLTLAPQALDIVAGAVNLDLSPITLTLAPQALDPVEGAPPAGENVDLAPVTLTLVPQPLDVVAGVVNLDLVAVTINLAPQPLDPAIPPAATYTFFPPTRGVGPSGEPTILTLLEHPFGIALVLNQDTGLYEQKMQLHYETHVQGKVEGYHFFRGGYRYAGISQEVADMLVASGYAPVVE